MRQLGSVLVLLATIVLAPAASAAEDATDAAAAPTVGRVLDVVEGLAGSGVAAGASAASGAAAGASAAADGTASFLTVLADAAASAAAASVAAVAAVGRALAAAGAALASFAAVAASAIASAARALAAVVTALASAVGTLLGRGVGWMAEHPREALYGTAAVGGAAATGGLLYWLKRLGAFAPLAGLYTRLTSGEMLNNEVRAKVFDEVRGNPGAHPSQIKDKLGLGWGTVVYHLDRLEETGLVTSRTGSGRKCYFVNGSGIAPAAQQAATALKHPSAKAIADIVRAQPGVTQKTLTERTGMSPALVSWHVRKLAAAGILAQERTSRGVVLRPAPGLEAPAVAA